MNLEKILAENILRFGVKNLDSQAIKTVNRILEQSTKVLPKSIDELQDSPEVKAAPGYSEIIPKLITLANKNSGNSKKSLQYWQGELSNSADVKFTNNIITAYKNIDINKLTDPALKQNPTEQQRLKDRYATLGKLVTELETLKTNNVYINIVKNLPILQRLTVNKVVTIDSKYMLNILNQLQIDEIARVLTNLKTQDKSGNDVISKSVVSPITDSDKIQLLAAAMEQIDKRKEKKVFRSGINSVNSIIIAPSNEIAQVIRTAVTSSQSTPYSEAFIYPDPNKADSLPAGQTFFGDDQAIVSAEQKQKFATILSDAVNSFKKRGITLTEVRYNAGSSTSQVSSGYVGPGQLSKIKTSENNIKLAAARCQAITKVLSDVITENPDTAKLTKTELRSDPKPNQGPAYNRKDWKWNDDGTLNPVDKSKYEELYAKHRFSFGAFTLMGTVPPDPVPDTLTYGGTGAWRISLQWPSVDIPTITPSKGGGVSVYPTDGGAIKCPKFN